MEYNTKENVDGKSSSFRCAERSRRVQGFERRAAAAPEFCRDERRVCSALKGIQSGAFRHNSGGTAAYLPSRVVSGGLFYFSAVFIICGERKRSV